MATVHTQTHTYTCPGSLEHDTVWLSAVVTKGTGIKFSRACQCGVWLLWLLPAPHAAAAVWWYLMWWKVRFSGRGGIEIYFAFGIWQKPNRKWKNWHLKKYVFICFLSEVLMQPFPILTLFWCFHVTFHFNKLSFPISAFAFKLVHIHVCFFYVMLLFQIIILHVNFSFFKFNHGFRYIRLSSPMVVI